MSNTIIYITDYDIASHAPPFYDDMTQSADVIFVSTSLYTKDIVLSHLLDLWRNDHNVVFVLINKEYEKSVFIFRQLRSWFGSEAIRIVMHLPRYIGPTPYPLANFCDFVRKDEVMPKIQSIFSSMPKYRVNVNLLSDIYSKV
jgi:hypothetical protein